MSLDPGELKADLRRNLRAKAKDFSATERATASEAIRSLLEKQAVWKQAQSILFYFPMPDEPDIHPLFGAALAGGKTALLPRFSASEGHYVACPVRDLDSDLQLGAFGIQEPNSACPIFDLKKLDFVLVPGIGFALNGFRLGRGKGYYDRLLAEMPGFKCGVAFDWQIVFEIPAEPHDICVDCILTPTRWHEVKGPRRS